MSLNEINGETSVYGIIGNPVSHSLSPFLQNAFAKEENISAVYVPFPVKKGELKAAISAGLALSIKGFNITAPYKQEVIPFLGGISEGASKIGAVNTLKLDGRSYFGYNTDIDGLYKTFLRHNIHLAGKKILVLGAGGAAAAVFALIAREKAKEAVVGARDTKKAEALCERLLGGEIKYTVSPFSALPNDADIIIQTTPLKDLKLSDGVFKNALFILDIIYSAETEILKTAKAKNIPCANGLEMLFFQGITSFEIWNGITLDKSKAEKVFNKLNKHFYGTGG